MKIKIKLLALLTLLSVCITSTSCMSRAEENDPAESTEEITSAPEESAVVYGSYETEILKMTDFCEMARDMEICEMVRPDAYMCDDGKLYTLDEQTGRITEFFTTGDADKTIVAVPEVKDVVLYRDSDGTLHDDRIFCENTVGDPVAYNGDLYLITDFHPSVITLNEDGELFVSIFVDDANPEQLMTNEPLKIKVDGVLYDTVDEYTESYISVGGKKYCPYYNVGCDWCGDVYGPYCKMNGHTLVMELNTEDYPENIETVLDCDYRNHDIPYSRALTVYTETGNDLELNCINGEDRFKVALPDGYSSENIDRAFIRELKHSVAALFVIFDDGTVWQCVKDAADTIPHELQMNEGLSEYGEHIESAVCESPRVGTVCFTLFMDDKCAYSAELQMLDN